ncbi:MAG: hypothetical protein K5662_05430 [Lachnospiraceae bacterium]|nr:hypothetical protein [Lachnospiraceae bacterium]
MKERILAYRHRIDGIIGRNDPATDWEEVMSEHLTQIAFFQHERIIHLIVTVTFAILTIISVGMVLSGYIYCIALTLLLLALLIPYVAHYYLLENEVQTMYVQYDKILDNIKKSRTEAVND